MSEPTIKLSGDEEKSITVQASNYNAGRSSGRAVKVKKNGQTNLKNIKPGEVINLELDLPISNDNATSDTQSTNDIAQNKTTSNLTNDSPNLPEKNTDRPKVESDQLAEQNEQPDNKTEPNVSNRQPSAPPTDQPTINETTRPTPTIPQTGEQPPQTDEKNKKEDVDGKNEIPEDQKNNQPPSDETKTPPLTPNDQLPTQQSFQPGNGPAEPSEVQPGQEGNVQQEMRSNQQSHKKSGQSTDNEKGFGEQIKDQAGNYLNEKKTVIKNKFTNVKDGLFHTKMGKLKKQKNDTLKKLAKLDEDFNALLSSSLFRKIQRWMPGLGSRISGALNTVDSVAHSADGIKQAQLQAKVSSLKMVISSLKLAKTIAGLIDGFNFWLTAIVLPTFCTIIIPILSILILPGILIFFVVIGGALANTVKKMIKEVKKILQPIEEKLKKMKSRKFLKNRLSAIDEGIINLKKQQRQQSA